MIQRMFEQTSLIAPPALRNKNLITSAFSVGAHGCAPLPTNNLSVLFNPRSLVTNHGLTEQSLPKGFGLVGGLGHMLSTMIAYPTGLVICHHWVPNESSFDPHVGANLSQDTVQVLKSSLN